MGRRKKEATASYIDIIVSSYVSKEDYAQAQREYASNLGDPLRGITKSKARLKEGMLGTFEDWGDLDEDCDDF